MRIAWFSPFPPVRTGIAGRSAELVAALAARGYAVDPYPEAAAHDFPWRHRQDPCDLVVYQFGNSSHHDYIWPYALRYPGLVVLHDTRLHHARAALLLREKRIDDYRAEFAWNEPDVSPDAAELAVAGFDSRLYYEWPMVRGLVAASRLTAVHGEGARADLIAAHPPMTGRIVAIRLGEGERLTPEREAAARTAIRRRYGIAGEAIVFGCFGGMTPEKRLPQVLAAFRATLRHTPGARLLLAGAPAAHYDLAADIAAHGLQDQVIVAGYLETDAGLTDHLAACDVSLNLRWPTARETSGPWLRALAAGRPTIITDLVHMDDVPSLDPRTWTVNAMGERWAMPDSRWSIVDEIDERRPDETRKVTQRTSAMDDQSSAIDHRPSIIGHRSSAIGHRSSPIAVAIDILDEDHSLRLAMRRLADDGALRAQLGTAAREWWSRTHTPDLMADDYERIIAEAIARPAPEVPLPPHMRNAGDGLLRGIVASFGLRSPLDS